MGLLGRRTSAVRVCFASISAFVAVAGGASACGARSDLDFAQEPAASGPEQVDAQPAEDGGGNEASSDATIDLDAPSESASDTAVADSTGDVIVADGAGDLVVVDGTGDAVVVDATDASADVFDGGDVADSAQAPDASDAGASDASEAAAADASDDVVTDASVDAADEDAPTCATLYVGASTGLDGNSGAIDAPLKTITRAIALARLDACVATIRVAPGTYDDANGETFPLQPANVALIGDEANKGNATSGRVFIHGAASFGWDLERTALLVASGVTIAGFTITADGPQDAGIAPFYEGIHTLSATTGVIVRNNTFVGNLSTAVYMTGTRNAFVSANVATGNHLGFFTGAGATVKYEANVARENQLGFELDYAGADLGGGPLGSAGGNVLACNWATDLWVENPTPAQNNLWDHVPPTTSQVSDTGGVDIFEISGSADVAGAGVAPNNCP